MTDIKPLEEIRQTLLQTCRELNAACSHLDATGATAQADKGNITAMGINGKAMLAQAKDMHKVCKDMRGMNPIV